MVTAEEARKRAELYRIVEESTELKFVFLAIEEGYRNGSMSAEYRNMLSTSDIKHLRNLGFNVVGKEGVVRSIIIKW